MRRGFKNLKIGTRIIIGFLLVAFIACIIGVVGVYNLKSIDSAYTLEYKNSVDALEHVERVSSSFQQIRSNLNGFLLADTQKDKEYYIERMVYHKGFIDKHLSDYKQMLSKYEASEVVNELELIDEVQTSLIEFGSLRIELVEGIGMDPDRRSESFELIKNGGELHTFATKVNNAITELVNYNNNYAENQIITLGKQAQSSTIIMILVMVMGIVIAVFIGAIISRGISQPIKDLVKAADALALGDVEVNIKSTTKDEIGELMNSFSRVIENILEQANVIERISDADLTVEITPASEKDVMGHDLVKLTKDLNEIINNIAVSSEQVATGAKQVSDSSIILSQGATEQASSIEELTASIEEIASQTKLNAQNANQANELAERAKQNAVQGNAHMQEMLKAMEEINESSTNISKIIKVIDDIAFQTNMLALNAAVEAARAGQHGKGFAVVAEEVKNLAARSANAARETTEMIEGSIQRAEGGTRIAKETADDLNTIVVEIERVANLVNDISVASTEQEVGISQINQGIMQVSEVVQNNSATSEEGAAASEELSSQAELLQEIVRQFKTKKTYTTSDTLGNLSPEILKMLDGLPSEVRNRSNEGKISKKTKDINISLSDKEFGKY